MIKKILLINPSNTVQKDCIRRLVTPLGLLYMAGLLGKNGYEVKILDSPCEGYENVVAHDDYVTYGLNDEQIKERIKEENPDAAGIACSFSSHEKKIYHLCKLIKSVSTDILTFSGGIQPSFYPEKMLNCTELDVVIMKEGEFRSLKLFDAINKNQSYEEIDGIGFKKDGKVIVNPPTSFIKNLDDLPFPARHLIDMEKYIKINAQSNPFSKQNRVERIMTSRGCPYNCCFCAGSAYWGNIRMRSVDNVIGELKILADKYDIREIHFSDDNLTIDKNRAVQLFKRMKEEFSFDWCTPSGVMMATLDEEMIKAMAECGCYQVTFSPETGNQRVLNEIIHKPFDLKKVKPLVDICHKYGIDVHSNFIVGLPGETKEEMMETFDFAKDSNFDSACFFIAVPYAGTDLYDQCKSKGWLSKDSSTDDFKHANIIINESEKEYVMPRKEMEELVEKKTQEFNEWSKKKNSEKWNKKYKGFLSGHKNDSKKIMGRII